LVRKCIDRAGAACPETLDGQPFRAALMAPTRLYVKPVLEVLKDQPIKALAHITGGGLTENIPRVLPAGLGVDLQRSAWPQTELFAWLQQTAGIDESEMNRTFNNGIGMVAIVPAAQASAVQDAFTALGEQAYAIGTVVTTDRATPVIVHT